MKIQILFILFYLTSNSEASTERIESPKPRLRTFAIYSLKALSNLAKNYEQQQKLLNEIEIRETRRKNEKMALEEQRRRKAFQAFFDSRQASKSFLNDFHVDRYY